MAGGGRGPLAVILILAPHPDDEVVACGISAMRADRVGVLYLTTGVPMGRDYRLRVGRRRQEALAAAQLLGIEPVGFLDAPSRTLRHHLDAAYAEVERVAAREIWVPAFEGGHQDHDAANALASRARCPVREFAAYSRAGANRFVDVRGGETFVAANPAETALKWQALAIYRSERGNLRGIGAAREAWRPLPPRDYGVPPHPGRLLRERYHWVPFRHPRVDFDPSSEVYAGLRQWVDSAAGAGS